MPWPLIVSVTFGLSLIEWRSRGSERPLSVPSVMVAVNYMIFVIAKLPFDTVVVTPELMSRVRTRIAGRDLPLVQAADTDGEAEDRIPL